VFAETLLSQLSSIKVVKLLAIVDCLAIACFGLLKSLMNYLETEMKLWYYET